MEQQAIQRAWFLIVLAVVTVAFLWLTLDFIEPVFWAAVLAVIFNPLQRQLEVLVGGKKTRAAVISLLIIVLVVFVPLILLGLAVSQEAVNLYNRIQSGSLDVQAYLTRVSPMLEDLSLRIGIEPGSIQQRIFQAAGLAAQTIATRAVVVGQNLLSVVAKTGLMLYLLFFFLRDGDRLVGVLGDAIPMGVTRQRTLFSQFASVTRATLKGSLLIGLVQGALGGLLFLALDLSGVEEVAGLSPLDWHRRCLHSVRTSGLPARLYPGFWDNDGRCCGTAGVADVFLDLWQSDGQQADLDFVLRLTDTVVERSEGQPYWRFVEHTSSVRTLFEKNKRLAH